MELLPDPQSLSAASTGLSLVGKTQLLARVLRALSYLHRHGILHRDSHNIVPVDKSRSNWVAE